MTLMHTWVCVTSGKILTGESRSTWWETYPSATLFTINPTWAELESSPALCCEGTGLTNSPNHGMAIETTIQNGNFQRSFIWPRTWSNGGLLCIRSRKFWLWGKKKRARIFFRNCGYCQDGLLAYKLHIYRGADKSLARWGRKHATATKILSFASHSKKFGSLSVQPGLHGSNDLRVGRKMATFQLLFQSGRAKDLSAPLYVSATNITLKSGSDWVAHYHISLSVTFNVKTGSCTVEQPNTRTSVQSGSIPPIERQQWRTVCTYEPLFQYISENHSIRTVIAKQESRGFNGQR